MDQHSHHSCDVDLAPAIGLGLVALLHIVHGGVAVHVVLYFQKFLHLGSGIPVGLSTFDGNLRAAQDGENIVIGLRELRNLSQVAVDMGDQILQRLIDDAAGAGLLDLQVALLGVGLGDGYIAGANVDGFTVHIEPACGDGLRQEGSGAQLIIRSLILLIADDILHRLG